MAIDKTLFDRGIDHLPIIITPTIFSYFTGMKWHRVNADSLTSGFPGNLFLFGSCNEEALNALNLHMQYIGGG